MKPLLSRETIWKEEKTNRKRKCVIVRRKKSDYKKTAQCDYLIHRIFHHPIKRTLNFSGQLIPKQIQLFYINFWAMYDFIHTTSSDDKKQDEKWEGDFIIPQISTFISMSDIWCNILTSYSWKTGNRRHKKLHKFKCNRSK